MGKKSKNSTPTVNTTATAAPAAAAAATSPNEHTIEHVVAQADDFTKQHLAQLQEKQLPASFRESYAEKAAAMLLPVVGIGAHLSAQPAPMILRSALYQLWQGYFESREDLPAGEGTVDELCAALLDLHAAIIDRLPVLQTDASVSGVVELCDAVMKRRSELIDQLHTRFPAEAEAKALALKNEGNASFGSGDFAGAIDIYKRGIALLPSTDAFPVPSVYFPSAPPAPAAAPPPPDSVRTLLCVLYSNMAQCHLNLYEAEAEQQQSVIIEGRIFRVRHHAALAASVASSALCVVQDNDKATTRLLAAVTVIRNGAKRLFETLGVRNHKVASGVEATDRNCFCLERLSVLPRGMATANVALRTMRMSLHMNNAAVYRALGDTEHFLVSYGAAMAQDLSRAEDTIRRYPYPEMLFEYNKMAWAVTVSIDTGSVEGAVSALCALALLGGTGRSITHEPDAFLDVAFCLSLLVLRCARDSFSQGMARLLTMCSDMPEFVGSAEGPTLLALLQRKTTADDVYQQSLKEKERGNSLFGEARQEQSQQKFEAAIRVYETATTRLEAALAVDPTSDEITLLMGQLWGNIAAAKVDIIRVGNQADQEAASEHAAVLGQVRLEAIGRALLALSLNDCEENQMRLRYTLGEIDDDGEEVPPVEELGIAGRCVSCGRRHPPSIILQAHLCSCGALQCESCRALNCGHCPSCTSSNALRPSAVLFRQRGSGRLLVDVPLALRQLNAGYCAHAVRDPSEKGYAEDEAWFFTSAESIMAVMMNLFVDYPERKRAWRWVMSLLYAPSCPQFIRLGVNRYNALDCLNKAVQCGLRDTVMYNVVATSTVCSPSCFDPKNPHAVVEADFCASRVDLGAHVKRRSGLEFLICMTQVEWREVESMGVASRSGPRVNWLGALSRCSAAGLPCARDVEAMSRRKFVVISEDGQPCEATLFHAVLKYRGECPLADYLGAATLHPDEVVLNRTRADYAQLAQEVGDRTPFPTLECAVPLARGMSRASAQADLPALNDVEQHIFAQEIQLLSKK